MQKKNLLIIFILQVAFDCSFCKGIYGQNLFLVSNSDVISNFKHLSPQQLFDTANFFYSQNATNTALACYSLLINTPVKNPNVEHQKKIVEAYNNSAILYSNMCDYRTAYNLFITALLLCEKINDVPYISKIYNNIGSIYFCFNKYDMAKLYYLKVLSLSSDSSFIASALNNLGIIKLESKELDSAYYFLNTAQQIKKRHNNMRLHTLESNLALLYKEKKQYDSAFYYLRLSLIDSKNNNKKNVEAFNFFNLGKLFFEINQIDSALFYINLSIAIASENNFLGILADNYLFLSQIEEVTGREKSTLEYYKQYVKLRDSAINIEKFGDINQLQRLYEVSKTNKQIEELAIEQRIKEHTIHLQRIVLIVLLLICSVLVVIYFQKKKLDAAYRALYKKNVETIDFQEKLSQKYQEKYRNSVLTHDFQEELLSRILVVMEDASVICDPDFSIGTLVELVQSNYTYVSQVINNVSKKNFRSFLNTYRIREAQRIFSEPDAAKYTIEAIAQRVGFKSRNTFRDTFKEITGVSPSFYLKSAQNSEN